MKMVSEIRSWLAEAALPHMVGEQGADWSYGGFAERLDWNGNRLPLDFKRVRVTARQIYALTHLALGGATDAAIVAERGMSFLLKYGRRGDGLFGSRIGSDGSPIDMTADLYDVAFAMFAIAWWYKFTGDSGLLNVAEEAIGGIRTQLRHPTSRGFLHRSGEGAPYQQNPHMHLLESAIFLAAFSGRSIFFDLARDLFELATKTFYDPRTHTLAEYFDSSWKRQSEDGTVLIEPGHHFEWSWLLCRYVELTADQAGIEIALKLFEFAENYGIDNKTGLVFDGIDELGRVLKPDFRSWPQLEYIKALLAMKELYPTKTELFGKKIDKALDNLFLFFLDPDGATTGQRMAKGLWIDHIQVHSLRPKVDYVPVSTFYHLTLALTEVTRHRSQLPAFGGLPW